MTSLMAETSAEATDLARSLPLVAEMGIEDNSPFGLQGLKRETLTVLKETAVKPLAASLALCGPHQPPEVQSVTERILERNPEWVDEYRVIHLVERSLWFEGQRDFVMQMMRNPSQIPDNPPAEIREALAKAYSMHPEATVWYGVPLFGEKKNASGLPIPLTAPEVQSEAQRRLAAAQAHALRMGWFYRSLGQIRRLPQSCQQMGRRGVLAVKAFGQRCVSTYRQARADAKRRRRASARAELERTRSGRSRTVIPEHTTGLGKLAARATSTLTQIETRLARSTAMTEEFIENRRYAAAGIAVLPVMALQVMPLFLAPAAVVACDPFLFIELPDEPGKLRMIGHWYWQPQPDGREKLHVHT